MNFQKIKGCEKFFVPPKFFENFSRTPQIFRKIFVPPRQNFMKLFRHPAIFFVPFLVFLQKLSILLAWAERQIFLDIVIFLGKNL